MNAIDNLVDAKMDKFPCMVPYMYISAEGALSKYCNKCSQRCSEYRKFLRKLLEKL